MSWDESKKKDLKKYTMSFKRHSRIQKTNPQCQEADNGGVSLE
jgi:hypothetical protein